MCQRPTLRNSGRRVNSTPKLSSLEGDVKRRVGFYRLTIGFNLLRKQKADLWIIVVRQRDGCDLPYWKDIVESP